VIGRSVLVVGCGIAGPAVAYWLMEHGFSATIVERASGPRAGGYVIDLWGKGYDLVERMGLLAEVKRASVPLNEVRLVGPRGKREGGFDARVFREATGGRYASLARSDLSSILYDAVAPRVRTLWGDEPISFEQRAQGVWVEFRHAEPELFGLVVGADGLHSSVRQRVFGDSSRFERFLGFTVAAFETAGYPHRDEGVYVSFGSPGCQVARFALPNDRTLFLVVVTDDVAPTQALEQSAARQYLEGKLGGGAWELRQILQALGRSEHVYFDRVSQIHMPRWSRGAIALLGDAAYAPSLLGGQGAALAVIGAYVLAGELSHAVAPESAFERYQDTLRGFVYGKQEAAAKLANSFAPSSRLGIWLRNMATRTFAIPGVAKTLLGRQLDDKLELRTYA